MATAQLLPPSALFLSLLFVSCFTQVFAHQNSLVVAQFTSLNLTPSLPVEKSPGFKPGTKVLCERVDISGLSRLKNLAKFAHSVKVNVSHVPSSSRPPNVLLCFHRNVSREVGMCPQGQWGKLSKGSWAKSMSPFDHKVLDICTSGSSPENLKVSIDEDSCLYRIIFLVLGSALMTMAWALSKSLIFYYGSAMAIGVLLVILMILFQGMKLLPTGRKNSLAIFLYAILLGMGSMLFRDVPRLLRSVFVDMGIGEERNPVFVDICTVILCSCWSLAGLLGGPQTRSHRRWIN